MILLSAVAVSYFVGKNISPVIFYDDYGKYTHR